MYIIYYTFVVSIKNNNAMKALEQKAIETLSGKIFHGDFSVETTVENGILYVGGRYDKYDNIATIEEAYFIDFKTEKSTYLDTCMIEEYLNSVLSA